MDFANIESAKELINKLYPNAKNVSFVEHGFDNLVGLVDEAAAIRFPRNEKAYSRSQYETLILRDLDDLDVIAIPRILGAGVDPAYVITSFIKGQHLRNSEINRLPSQPQRKIGETIAKFACSMHTLLLVDKVREYRKKFGLDTLIEEPWDVYFENVISKQKFPTSGQDKLAKEYYERWRSLKFNTPDFVVHDDLHSENLMFEGDELVGVLDFGDTNIGTPEQELRQLYRINEQVLLSAVETYEALSGLKLDIEGIKVWSITQELAAYSDRIMQQKLDHPAFLRASRNLQRWLPEGNWEELLNGKEVNGDSKQ